ncbi:D-alanine--D-alanine ligase family protein [Williamwhitmania taraxaci]|uniref:D-alanine--D-alanine ligase n=1 Tax=Williamwhitmania taraxaci TaxID=1640674 RepID=A0A1G6IAF8_9BACT|nr:ATP-grasp domain-containing protein [Williamwhitmania taraxaci]SDC03507.1 D-alanine--D-alanine ligase [Williamwhitmania taraxaci]
MKAGITYDSKSTYLQNGFTKEEVAEFDSDETIEGIENALQTLGFTTERIGNIGELTKALTAGNRWDIVFNIAEGVYGIGREAQVPALLDAYKIPYVFSDPLVLCLTLHKGITKHVVRDCGIPTAPFKVVETMTDLKKVNLNYPLFIKPVAEGTGKGISGKSLIKTQKELAQWTEVLLEQFKQPVLVEEYLPGREFTVGIIGTGEQASAIGIMEVHIVDKSEDAIYSLFNKENYETRVEYSLPEKGVSKLCYKVALDAWRALGCMDGGRVDLRMDKNGVPNFIEVNPLAGLNPIHSDLPILSYKAGITYLELIERIMKSATQRLNLQMPKPCLQEVR